MDHTQIGRMRMVSQRIARPALAGPADVVRHLCAVQAQDYLGALWAVGLRSPGADEGAVERALADRAIVRTWPMRGTIHFVAPADVRWMLELLAPRVAQRSQGRLRQLGLDAQTIAAGAEAVARALEGDRQLTRQALYGVLEAAGIHAGGQRGLHILGQLAHQRLICFAARQGKQPAFALLDEWVPPTPALPRDEALATLALRYIVGHGPATAQDLMWWAGLTVAEARAALGAAAPQLLSAAVDGQTYYFAPDLPDAAGAPGEAFLLPPFDEFLIAYRDRGASIAEAEMGQVAPGRNGIFNPIVVIDGRVAGLWRRAINGRGVTISFTPFAPWSDRQATAAAEAAEAYGAFLGKAISITR